MIELVIVRHGQTEENLTKTLCGQLPGKLTSKGIEQAQKLGKALCEYNFDHCYVSDLKRTFDTFDNIAQNHIQSNLSSISEGEPLIREKCGGVLHGGKLVAFENAAKSSKKKIRDFKPEEGESWKDVFDRCKKFLEKIIKSHLEESKESSSLEKGDEEEKINSSIPSKKSTILAVSHGGFIMELFNLIKFIQEGIEPTYANTLRNCSISVIQIKKKPLDENSSSKSEFLQNYRFDIIRFNDGKHVNN